MTPRTTNSSKCSQLQNSRQKKAKSSYLKCATCQKNSNGQAIGQINQISGQTTLVVQSVTTNKKCKQTLMFSSFNSRTTLLSFILLILTERNQHRIRTWSRVLKYRKKKLERFQLVPNTFLERLCSFIKKEEKMRLISIQGNSCSCIEEKKMKKEKKNGKKFMNRSKARHSSFSLMLRKVRKKKSTWLQCRIKLLQRRRLLLVLFLRVNLKLKKSKRDQAVWLKY